MVLPTGDLLTRGPRIGELPQHVQRPLDIAGQGDGIERGELRGQRLPLLGGALAGGQYPRVRRLGDVVALEDPAPDPALAAQLADGAEEVVVQAEQAVEPSQDGPGGAGAVAVVADEPPHEQAVARLDPGLVVLAIRSPAGEADPAAPAPAEPAGVDELAAIVEYEGMRKREATSPPCSGYPFSRLPRHEGGTHMPDDRCRLGSDDVVIGLDLASVEHQVVVLTADGQRLTRFKIPHSRVGLEELLRRTMPAALSRTGGSRVFAFEATGHVWEAVAYILRARGERYVVINPLTTFRVREARQLSREKTDLTDAEQIAELCRSGLVTRTQLEARPYLALRRAWGEYRRFREERARLKVLVAHHLVLTAVSGASIVWSDQPTTRRKAWRTLPARSSTAASSRRTWRRAFVAASCCRHARPAGGASPSAATVTAPSATVSPPRISPSLPTRRKSSSRTWRATSRRKSTSRSAWTTRSPKASSPGRGTGSSRLTGSPFPTAPCS